MHNMLRALHGAPPLSWNTNLEVYAKMVTNRCVFSHSYGSYGENLGLGYPTIMGAVHDWYYREVNLYDYDWPRFEFETGHFTQLVWASTRRVGCALTDCPDLGRLIACSYDPPGNYEGRFTANVRPLL